MNRRTFVSSLAVGGAALAAGSRLYSAGSSAKPKARIGIIGCGWYGGVIYEAFARNVDATVVSLCDPNARNLQKTLQAVARHQTAVPRTFADYREMLAAEQHDIVVVATPDHWHALNAIAAMQAGADVFLEKAISVDVIEGEAILAAARKYDRVVQINTQRRSNPLYLEVRDKYLRSGKLGRIGQVETYSFLGLEGWSAGPIPDAPIPAHLDFDMWTGPAPLLPYKAIIEDRGWRAFMEFGNGIIGNVGVHMLDKVRWLLDLGWPRAVSATGGRFAKESFSNTFDTMRSVLRYPDLDVSWEHRMWGVSPIPRRHWSDQWGARFIGEKGTLNVTMFEYVFTPTGDGAREGVHMLSKTGDLENVDFGAANGAYRETEDRHVQDFMQAREERGAHRRPIADVEQGHISSACCILSNLSLELGRPLVYDPKSRAVPGDPEATRRLARPYRAPWTHPDPATV
ncbi:Gfo/Idh/MocA family oxidoreductase [Opitutales bacterium ASA1]|uniref:Gfo/Idh/MocA family protein n=1 Tax=Congregicoccus parvus TaxID=3081749 RepID=UPI002B2B0273|nr:Gfo/Idh/MocA family oxidoreductase [Opitutales bacterium ASA1]